MGEWKKTIDLKDVGLNKTSKYLLPACEIKAGFPIFVENGFKNAYIDWKDGYDSNKNCLYFLFSPGLSTFKKWKEFYSIYSSQVAFVKDYYIDYGVIVVCFKLNKSHGNLIDLLIKGQYSKFPDSYKRLFIKSNGEKLYQFDILTKNDTYRKKMEKFLLLKENTLLGRELESIPELEEEILNYPKLLEKYGLQH